VDIYLYSAEKKSIISVLLLYLSSTLILVFVLSYTYYQSEKEKLQSNEQKELKQYAKEMTQNLRDIQNNFFDTIIYPRDNRYNSAIYDIDKNLIFSTTKNKNIKLDEKLYCKDGYSYYIHEISPYYLGTAYIAIEKKSSNILDNIQTRVQIVTLFVVALIIFTSIFLVKIVLKPIRDNLNLLDRFIKDTTHELNTPISTILTNIELIESSNIEDKRLSNKIERIKIASTTISNLYEDLTYLVLNNKTSSQDEDILLNEIIKERVEYFALMLKAKNISIDVKYHNQAIINIDKKKITKVIDNVVSNSIKYSKKDTNINIIVDTNYIEICDEGKGMSAEELTKVFDRFSRFDDTQGGFGLGYNIVYSILQEYNINIDIKSKVDEGTCVRLSW
jgi:two-component system OmpR family sensor kinase